MNSDTDASLVRAATTGDVQYLGRLLPVCHNVIKKELAIEWAAHNGHVPCVELLMPHVKHEQTWSRCLAHAFMNNHAQLCDVLHPFACPNEVIALLKINGGSVENTILFEQWFNAKQEKKILEQEMSIVQGSNARSKKM